MERDLAVSVVGTNVRRTEDPPLITGAGCYLEDIKLEGLADVALLRSSYAHARIVEIDTTAAEQLPGVIAVLTAADLDGFGSVPVADNMGSRVPAAAGATVTMRVPPQPPLADGVVRYAGEPVAAVVAENRYIAQDAVNQIVVQMDPLPAVADAARAREPGAPVVHEAFPDNVAYHAAIDVGDADGAFATAAHRLRLRVAHSRVAAVPIEPRGGIAQFDPTTESYTVWLSTQAAWTARADLAAALGISPEQIRVITPDVGGAFGAKMTIYREDVLLLALARLTGRPVRWIATRTEDLQSSMHGREAFTDAEVAFEADGQIRALRLQTVVNFGAYLMKNTGLPPLRMLTFPTGAYTIRNVQSEVVGVFTNTGPVGPYRGAGRPEAAFLIERVVDDVAAALGMDPTEVRRRNFVPREAFPYVNAAGVTYDSGDYELALDRALQLLDYAGTRAEVEARRRRGEVIGLGIASCVEPSGGGWEQGSVTLHADGTTTVYTGTSPHGQGLATSFAQIVSDRLGVALDSVTIRYGDTAEGPPGIGTAGSRSLQLGGSAIAESCERIRERLLQTAAELLEVAPEDLELHDGMVGPRGAPHRSVPLQEVIRRHLEVHPESSLSETTRFTGAETVPFGTTIALVSIDPETGRVTIERYVSVDDVGRVINPTVVEGQLVGGAAQGIGEALLEGLVYDESGQLLTGSLLDYAVPRARHLPRFEFERTETPTPHNPLGAKGVGEAGTVHAPVAVANAVVDALRHTGVSAVELPLTDEKVWRILQRAARSSDVGAG